MHLLNRLYCVPIQWQHIACLSKVQEKGTLCSLAHLIAAIFPLTPRLPKPPGTTIASITIEGPNGKLFKGFKSDIPDLEKRLAEFPEPEPQVTDFIEAVKERKKFALNEVNGHRSCTIVNLAKIALRTRRRLKFDSDKQRFINDDEANGYIKQPMRGPWKV